jgi:hypothetical protein
MTEVPTFANDTQRSALLEQEGVEVNAEPLSSGRSLLVTNQSYINAIPEHWVVFTSWVDDLPL